MTSSERAADVTGIWHRHELVLVGFRDAARGPGGVPWPLDAEHQHQGLTARLVARSGGAPLPRHAEDLPRAIARAQEARHSRLLAAATSPGGGCTLDLNPLLPIPAGLLALGSDHAAALDWLDRRWGTREPVRHVELQETRDPKRRSRRRLRVRFWMLDGCPEILAAALRASWPMLELHLDRRETEGG